MLDSSDEDTLGIMSSFRGNLGRFGPHVAHRKNAGKLARKCPLASLAQNALLYAVCGDDIHAHMRVATRFFADRHVGEKFFRPFWPICALRSKICRVKRVSRGFKPSYPSMLHDGGLVRDCVEATLSCAENPLLKILVTTCVQAAIMQVHQNVCVRHLFCIWVG